MRERLTVFSVRWLPAIVAAVGLLANSVYIGKVYGEISHRLVVVEKKVEEIGKDTEFETQLKRWVSRPEWTESIRENKESHAAIIKIMETDSAETKAYLLRIEEKIDKLQGH